MNAYRHIRKTLMEEANSTLSALSKCNQDMDIESAVEEAKQLGHEAVCHLLSENIGRRGQLKSLKRRLGEQIEILDRTLEQDDAADAIEVRHMYAEFRNRCDEASSLLPKYEELVQYILEAWYESEVARSATKKELEERIASYQRVLDHSNKTDHQETMNQAAKLILTKN